MQDFSHMAKGDLSPGFLQFKGFHLNSNRSNYSRGGFRMNSARKLSENILTSKGGED